MIEERTRYCAFVNLLQPVVKEECEVMFELGHLQEAMQSIAIVTKDPGTLPQASEELIMDAKSNMNLYPESPGGNSGSHGCSNSLGSRKSSVCSISSINSSGSSSSPGHHHYQRSISQFISPSIRLKPGESSDSVDQIYEDSIQELNNLIGELDSFQREHEAKEKLRMYSNSSSSSNNGHHLNQIPVNGNNGVFGTSDAESDKISLGSLNYSTHSTKYSDSEIS
uniref:IMD domain-containing protein n=1 Tax=Megaselia scalaris TaxID=36166 RepID=T1GN68_MEGSC